MDILDKRTELLLYACASIVFGLLALDAIQRPALYNPYPIGGFGVTILSITFACIFAVKLEKDKKNHLKKLKIDIVQIVVEIFRLMQIFVHIVNMILRNQYE